MANAVERFRTDLLAGRVRHPGDEQLTRHVLNAQIQESRYGAVLTESRPGSPDKIDAAMAAVLAWEACADAIAARADKPRRPGVLITF
jgi:phage terminase large subunit-like protein